MPRPSATHNTGFTLLELLVVLLIIGVVSSFAVLSTGLADRDKALQEESQRLLALLRMASEEAVLHSTELAIRFDSASYRFMRYEQGVWKPLEDDLYRPRTLPDDLAVDLQLEGRPIVLDEPSKDTDTTNTSDADQKLTPQIMFLSSGEVSPFVLTLSQHQGSARDVIKSLGEGSFTLNAPDTDKKP